MTVNSISPFLAQIQYDLKKNPTEIVISVLGVLLYVGSVIGDLHGLNTISTFSLCGGGVFLTGTGLIAANVKGYLRAQKKKSYDWMMKHPELVKLSDKTTDEVQDLIRAGYGRKNFNLELDFEDPALYEEAHIMNDEEIEGRIKEIKQARANRLQEDIS